MMVMMMFVYKYDNVMMMMMPCNLSFLESDFDAKNNLIIMHYFIIIIRKKSLIIIKIL